MRIFPCQSSALVTQCTSRLYSLHPERNMFQTKQKLKLEFIMELSTESAETTTSSLTTIDAARAASDQSSTVTTVSPVDISTASTSTMSTMTTSNLMALEESFGGTTREPDPVLPPKRKSGLYFLVDWNSFLEVGEDDKEKVNLRFQPKVGDRTRFLPVTVP